MSHIAHYRVRFYNYHALGVPPPFAKRQLLYDRDRLIKRMIYFGFNYEQIGAFLGISRYTVATCVYNYLERERTYAAHGWALRPPIVKYFDQTCDLVELSLLVKHYEDKESQCT